MSYKDYTIQEAVYSEQCKNFVYSIRGLDSSIAIRRLIALLNSNSGDVRVTDLMGQFLSLYGHETSVD